MASASQRRLLSAFSVAGLLAIVTGEAAIAFDRASVRISYVSQAERLTRHTFSADGLDEISTGGLEAIVDPDDTFLAQAACASAESGEKAYPQQAFLRFVREDTGADSMYVMQQKSIGMRVELAMKKEIRDDKKFWSHDAIYRVEIIVGDTQMTAGISWVAIKRMKFSSGSASVFKPPAGGVFDFDVGVKKSLLPEFSSPLPHEEKQAPSVAILVALVALLAPFPLVFVAWARLGVFPMSVPGGATERMFAFGFEICLLLHVAALTMFWLQWNIVHTWKVMATIMPPTIFFGQKTLSAASRSAFVEQPMKRGKDE